MLSRAISARVGVLLVDDHPIVRFGFIALLRQADESLVFHETDNAKDAMEIARRHAPSIALVDLSLAGALSLELIKRMRVAAPSTPILVVSMHDERLYAGSYSDDSMRWWADRIGEWQDQGRDVLVYFNNDGEGNAVRNAWTLKDLLSSSP